MGNMTSAEAQAMIEDVMEQERAPSQAQLPEAELTEDPIQGAFDHEVKPWLRRELDGILKQLDKKMQGVMRGQFPEKRMEYGITRYAPMSMGPKDFLKSLRTPYQYWRSALKATVESVCGDEQEPISEIKTPDGFLDEASAGSPMQKHADAIYKLTDWNDHSGAVLYLAQKVLKDKKLTKVAKAIQDIHNAIGSMPYHLGQFRSTEFWNGFVDPTAKKKLSSEDYDLIMGSF